MTRQKRAFDLAFALLGILLMAIPALIIVALLLVLQGRPILYRSERMKTASLSFLLLKFRTMKNCPFDSGVTGGDKTNRIAPLGHFLRRTRMDEIPQLWNILRGDISFIGPRPPLRQYVEQFPEVYAQVLKSKPGVTGLATLVFYAREEQLLNGCRSAAETEAVYVRRCLPRKARIDLIYQRNQTVKHDFVLLWRTVARLIKWQNVI
jgi:lipopolysaccharide/colanic/teichoic acid biosynthesis glycosyltransferase